MAKRLSISYARINQKKGKIDNPKDAFADQISWRSQEIQAVIQRRVKSGAFDKQIAAWLDRRTQPLYRLSRGYYAGTLEAIGRRLGKGFSMNLEQMAAHPEGLVNSRAHEKLVFFPGKPSVNAEIRSGRERKSSIPWRYPPIKYVAIYGKDSKKHKPGALRDPYGKWKGMDRSKVFWRKTGTLEQAYHAWLADARLRQTLTPYGYEVVPPDRRALQLRKQYKGTPAETMGRFSFRLPLEYPDLGSPAMNRLVRQAFITGRGNTYRVYQGIGKRNGAPPDVTRIAYPEFRRPWVSRFAAQMGLKQREAIRQLLKKW